MTPERYLHPCIIAFELCELCSHPREFGLILAGRIPLWATAKCCERLQVCSPTSHCDDGIPAERKPGGADPHRINAAPKAGIGQQVIEYHAEILSPFPP
jgi:hypothetical protein